MGPFEADLFSTDILVCMIKNLKPIGYVVLLNANEHEI